MQLDIQHMVTHWQKAAAQMQRQKQIAEMSVMSKKARCVYLLATLCDALCVCKLAGGRWLVPFYH